jgi:hypothetical protein
MFPEPLKPTLAGVLSLALCPPLQAAESAIVRYSVIEQSMSVAELSRLSETGEVSPALATQLKLIDKDPAEFRRILNQKISIDPVFLSRILNSSIGENLLDLVSEVIYTPGKRASRQALRGALVTSALDDKQIQSIEILENYPTAEVHVDGERLVALVNQINGAIASLSRLPRLPL